MRLAVFFVGPQRPEHVADLLGAQLGAEYAAQVAGLVGQKYANARVLALEVDEWEPGVEHVAGAAEVGHAHRVDVRSLVADELGPSYPIFDEDLALFGCVDVIDGTGHGLPPGCLGEWETICLHIGENSNKHLTLEPVLIGAFAPYHPNYKVTLQSHIYCA